ncbi:MAG: glucose-6-phosphate isomerase [Nitrospiraceae bacterium]
MASSHHLVAHLGTLAPVVEQALQQLRDQRVVARLWERDHRLWKPEPTEIANRLGWLTLVEQPVLDQSQLNALRAHVRQERIRDVVLLGMGGSSLGPEVLRLTFGSRAGAPRLWVLDTTVPATVRAVSRAIRPAKTLFLVASKSGGTIEVMSLLAHFEALIRSTKGNRGGAQFVAITDPDTGLADLAREKGFLRTFVNPPDIGGRYSVLSYFGMVPAALIGIDALRLSARAGEMGLACRETEQLEHNPGAYLGAVLGALARARRDKVTLLTSPAIRSYGLWAEQLLAESTGKEGTGLIPVAQEPPVAPRLYGSDRVFVSLRLKGDANTAFDRQVAQLRASGHPLIELTMRDRYDLGAEFFRWEFATAVAGHLLRIHPFDQPNVQESKDNTGRILTDRQTTGRLPDVDAVTPKQALPRLLADCPPGSYLAILAYLHPTKQTDAAIRRLRAQLVTHLHLATTAGYGPRYLHSTGQAHKGGPATGYFLQLVESPKPDVPIPGKPFTFGTLARAQAIGDMQAFTSRTRPIVQVQVGASPTAAFHAMEQSIRAFTKSPATRTATPSRASRSTRKAKASRR